jgi:hypothetical protein
MSRTRRERIAHALTCRGSVAFVNNLCRKKLDKKTLAATTKEDGPTFRNGARRPSGRECTHRWKRVTSSAKSVTRKCSRVRTSACDVGHRSTRSVNRLLDAARIVRAHRVAGRWRPTTGRCSRSRPRPSKRSNLSRPTTSRPTFHPRVRSSHHRLFSWRHSRHRIQ